MRRQQIACLASSGSESKCCVNLTWRMPSEGLKIHLCKITHTRGIFQPIGFKTRPDVTYTVGTAWKQVISPEARRLCIPSL